jgi:hypothetical protein
VTLTGIIWLRIESSYEDSNEPSGSVNCGKFLRSSTMAGLSKGAQLLGVS